MMRFYDGQHGFYAGIDRHARRLHLCVLDANGKVVKDVNIAATPDAFLAAIAPFRHDLVVGCECTRPHRLDWPPTRLRFGHKNGTGGIKPRGCPRAELRPN